MEAIKDYDYIAEARKAKAESAARMRGMSVRKKIRYLRKVSREFEKEEREYHRRQQQESLK
ncbi:hypothetical protein [Chitinophaga tropicalis]|uniref:Uncharacterized protein n=1 Tax=Chitinophaga tropicalis TaxID=2683588 RepID=A0A7K1U5A8_9BACT|nr:hypothetical protein [Chitinophaga tropicalis]MVT09165.1 hypothetical protein [Chitinophaga tropicalis]